MGCDLALSPGEGWVRGSGRIQRTARPASLNPDPSPEGRGETSNSAATNGSNDFDLVASQNGARRPLGPRHDVAIQFHRAALAFKRHDAQQVGDGAGFGRVERRAIDNNLHGSWCTDRKGGEVYPTGLAPFRHRACQAAPAKCILRACTAPERV